MVSPPALNAGLNATSAVLLIAGYCFIRRRRILAHKICMLSAFVASMTFLILYVVYHSRVGLVRFQGQGWIRPVYFSILIPHTILAIVNVPLALVTISRALRNRFDRHRRIARWTLPLWLYVCVTGVIIYWLLYHRYPEPARPEQGRAALACLAPGRIV